MPSPSSGGAAFSADFFGLTGEYSSSVNSSQQSLHIHQSPNQRLQQRQQKQQGPHSQHLQKWHWQIILMHDPMLNGREFFELLCLSYEILRGATMFINGSCRRGRESAQENAHLHKLDAVSKRSDACVTHELLVSYAWMPWKIQNNKLSAKSSMTHGVMYAPTQHKISIAWNPNNAPFGSCLLLIALLSVFGKRGREVGGLSPFHCFLATIFCIHLVYIAHSSFVPYFKLRTSASCFTLLSLTAINNKPQWLFLANHDATPKRTSPNIRFNK